MATVRTLIGYVKGPKGDTGATGATGPQGPAGQDGAPGVSDYATTEAAGLVRVGDDFSINPSNGILSIKNVWTKASTLAEMVSGEAFSTTLGKIAKALDAVVTIAGDYLKSTDIVDSLTSALTNKALSANKGKELKDALDSLNDSITALSDSFANINKVKAFSYTLESTAFTQNVPVRFNVPLQTGETNVNNRMSILPLEDADLTATLTSAGRIYVSSSTAKTTVARVRIFYF